MELGLSVISYLCSVPGLEPTVSPRHLFYRIFAHSPWVSLDTFPECVSTRIWTCYPLSFHHALCLHDRRSRRISNHTFVPQFFFFAILVQSQTSSRQGSTAARHCWCLASSSCTWSGKDQTVRSPSLTTFCRTQVTGIHS